MIGRIFYFISSIIFLLGVFIILSPTLLIPDVIYPVRIDSTYIAFHAGQQTESDSVLLLPSDLNLKYSEIQVNTIDDLKLNGWFVSAPDTPANTIILIHDFNESKLLYIDHLRQFHDRGFNTAVYDLRAHGSSGGNEFSPGIPSVDDVKRFTDSVLAKKGTRNLVFMGIGIGAAIALQASVYDNRCKGLVLQSPFSTYEKYLDKYAEKKWGFMKNIWFPVLMNKTSELLQYPVKELDLREIATYTSIPTFFIIGSDDEKVFTSETLEVFEASGTEKKELILVKGASHDKIAKEGGETYYNKISAFLMNTLPKQTKTTRFKKLVLNDH
jgi:alpha-beta hydrolase superfamily lysophospholipase